MSSEVAIRATNLCKSYRIYDHPFARVRQLLSLDGKKHYREFAALKDVSFEIRKGETVGVIGRNGSGKSTLLQLICGIRKPTSGSITVNGRIAALLELGAGFHPEFTGRENVYMQGARYIVRADHKFNLGVIANRKNRVVYRSEVITHFGSGRLSSQTADLRFSGDMPTIVRTCDGIFFPVSGPVSTKNVKDR
jgi:energy-coupling factor transporter ATP-binding protein EcfA2